MKSNIELIVGVKLSFWAALKLRISGITKMDSHVPIVHFEKASIKENDLIVLRHPGVLCEEGYRRLKETAKREFGTSRVIVLEENMNVLVLSPEEKK